MAAKQATKYERVETRILRVHKTACRYLTGARCNCAPSYRCEGAYDKRRGQRTAPKTFPSLVEAKRYRDDSSVRVGTGTLHAGMTLTVATAWELMRSDLESGRIANNKGEPYKPAVLRGYDQKMAQYVLPHFGRDKLIDLTTAHFQSFVDGLAETKLTGSTIRNTIMPVRVLYRWAMQRGHAAANPTLGLSVPNVGGTPRDRVAAPEEAVLLLDALRGTVAPWLVALYATAFYSGLRRGELMALDWANVDLAGGRWGEPYPGIQVIEAFDPTFKKGRALPKGALRLPVRGAGLFTLPKSKAAVRFVAIPDLLVRELAQLDRTSGLVFGNDGEIPFYQRKTIEDVTRAWKTAGCTPIGLHEARHTYASLMIRAGVNIKTISTYMGHSSITTTLDLYGHLLPGHGAEAMQLLNAYLETTA